MAKTKTYIVVRLKSPLSGYCKYMKMTRKCMDSIVAKKKGMNKYDPVVRKKALFTLSRAK